MTREARHVCATIRRAVRWVVYFQPTPAHERAGSGRSGRAENGYGDRLWPKPPQNPENHSGVADLHTGRVSGCAA